MISSLTVSHVEVCVLTDESRGKWVGDIVVVGAKAEIDNALDFGSVNE